MENKTPDFFKQFNQYEDDLLRQYEKHPLFLKIERLSDEQFIDVLTQYGEGISANFVKFLETAVRQIENEKAKEAIVRILRDEIPPDGPTHQMMRAEACAKIGIDPERLVATVLSPATILTLDRYYSFLRYPSQTWKNCDLAVTVFVRVIGESLVGVVYRVFTQELMRRFRVTEDDVQFYSFHWHHDEKGGTPFEGGEIGHTEYYDLALAELLQTTEDLEEAKLVADLALNIRCEFQDQFIK